MINLKGFEYELTIQALELQDHNALVETAKERPRGRPNISSLSLFGHFVYSQFLQFFGLFLMYYPILKKSGSWVMIKAQKE